MHIIIIAVVCFACYVWPSLTYWILGFAAVLAITGEQPKKIKETKNVNVVDKSEMEALKLRLMATKVAQAERKVFGGSVVALSPQTPSVSKVSAKRLTSEPTEGSAEDWKNCAVTLTKVIIVLSVIIIVLIVL